LAHKFTESTVEDAALDWFAELGYATASGPDLLPDGIAAERTSLAEVVLWSRLRDALTRINRKLPEAAIDEALRKLASNDAVLLIDRIHRSHDALVNGLDVEYQKGDGSIGYEKVRLVAFDVQTVKSNVAIDWTVRESVQANLRRLVKRTLRKYGYPPDKQEKATTLVLEQAALHAEWAA
jgi:type I restriction enzyme R subunit